MINLIILDANLEEREGKIFISSEFENLSYTEKFSILYDWIELLQKHKLKIKELEMRKIKDMS